MHAIGLHCFFKKAVYSKVNIQKKENSKKKKVKLKKSEFYIINKIISIIKINKKTRGKNWNINRKKLKENMAKNNNNNNLSH